MLIAPPRWHEINVSESRANFEGVGYVLLFGLGSVLGMGLLSAVIAVPLGFTARRLSWAHRAIRGATGVVSMVLGGVIVF